MRKKWVSGFVVVAVLLVFCVLTIVPAHAGSKVIKLQTVYPPLSQTAVNLKYFAEKVDQLTNGEVEIKIFWPGQLVAAKQGLSAVQKGMIDAFFVGVGLYFSGVIPEAAGEWLPYSWENTDDMMDIFLNYGYFDLLRTVYEQHGLYYVAPMCVGTQGLITKFPVRKLEDLKGKKIRSGGMGGYAVQAMGASPVSLAPAEIYTALQRGTADGTTYPWYCVEDYKFYEVANYISTPGMFNPGICDLIFNKKVWESLTPEQKEAVNSAGLQMFHNSKQLNDVSDEEAYAFCKANNVENITLSDEELKRFKKAVEPVYEEHGKKTAACARQLEILKQYAENKKAREEAKK